MSVRVPWVGALTAVVSGAAAAAAALSGCSSPSSAPPDVSPLVREGWGFYAAGAWEEAGERFEAALAGNPGSAPARAGLGFASARLRNFDPAAESLRRAIDLDSDLVEAFAGLALVEAARNNYPGVVAPATVLLILAANYVHPHDAEVNARAVRLVRAQAFYHGGDCRRAAEDLDLLDPAGAPHSTDPQDVLEALAALSGLGFSP